MTTSPQPPVLPTATSGESIVVPDEPALSVAALARRLGVAPATLRTWDRRYGVGPSGHTTGRHRRYGAEDIARLELMQRALLRGASPAEAARYALQANPQATLQPDPSRREPVRLHLAAPADDADVLVAEGDFRPATGRRAASGGRGLKLPGASRTARGLGRAVLAMDSPGAQRLLADAFDSLGVPAAWAEVIAPVSSAILARWETSGLGVETEHLLRECVLAALVRVTPVVSAPRNARPVLLACAPRERGSLPLYALLATLAAREIGTRMLGAALPADALAAAIRRTAPSAVVLWAQAPRHADPALAKKLPTNRTRYRLLFAGPGWRVDSLADQRESAPVRVDDELPDDLGAAADHIERVVVGI
ncbi:MAG TPA: MerR family transcriptional regulator [Pseudonocardiaceae bacterium]